MKSKKILILLAGLLMGAGLAAKEYTCTSPDGNVVITVSDGTALRWAVSFRGEALLEPGAIGMDLAGKQLGRRITRIRRGQADQQLEALVPVKRRHIRDHYRSLTVHLNGWAVEFRAYDNGAAYRILTDFRDPCIRVLDETAEWNFAGDFQAWWANETNPAFISHCEANFQERALSSIPDSVYSYLPVSLRTPRGTRMVVTESDLSDYPNLFLFGGHGTLLESRFPKAIGDYRMRTDRDVEILRNEDWIAATAGRRTYPWRILTIGDDRDLLENTLPWQLAPAPEDADWSWLRPGKISWEWWAELNVHGVDIRQGVNSETYKYYIDFAAAYGLEYILLDEGWSASTLNIVESRPELDLPELIRYGREKGVGVVLWTLWTPLRDDLEPILDVYRDWGVAGIKMDFMQLQDQGMVRFYERVADACARRHLVVDYHGAFKPAGLQRKYPNAMTFEGVYGMEHDKCSYDISPDHDLKLPFTRMVAGPMDYTPGATFNATREDFAIRWSHPMSQGTRAHQAALFVAFESPLMMLCDSPSNYYREPEFTRFIASIPTVWDETIALEARAGDCLVVARRNGNNWYVGALGNWQPHDLSLPLSFLPEGAFEAEVFADGVNADRWAQDYRREILPADRTRTLQVHLAPGGGWAAILRPATPPALTARPLQRVVTGHVLADGQPLEGVKISDGHRFVLTDAKGFYRMEAATEARFVFVCTPAGYIPADTRNHAPLFYAALDDAPAAVADFRLQATDDEQHTFVVWADVQVYEPHELSDYVDVAAAEVKAAMAGKTAFGISLGDLVGEWNDNLYLPVAAAQEKCGIPFYCLMGNHDYRRDVASNVDSKGFYEGFFGPTYYSFDKGRVHYVVLDDVLYTQRNFLGYIEDSQLDWLRKDLCTVPAGTPVVVFMHIPTFSRGARHQQWGKEEPTKIVNNRTELYRILAPYEAHLCTAHEHYSENYQIRDHLMEHVHGPLSGLFWQSLLACDGVPWGYYVYEVDGTDIVWHYQCVGQPRDRQMTVYGPGQDPHRSDEVVANVYNYDRAWKVEWAENGIIQGTMERFSGWDRSIVDEVEACREGWKWNYIGAGETEHLFHARPNDPHAQIEVVVTDRFGTVYRAPVRP